MMRGLQQILRPVQWLVSALASLGFWRYLALLAILLGSAAGTFAVYDDYTAPEPSALSEEEQLIPVRMGDLVNKVSTSGSLAFPERESVAFNSDGRLGHLAVAEGQWVDRGGVVARLDDSSLFHLEDAVLRAEAELGEAEDVLGGEEFEFAVEVLAAEEKVLTAESALEQARDALADSQQPYTNDQLQAQYEAVAATELDWQDARDALEALTIDNSQELVVALREVAGAELALETSRTDLSEYAADLEFQIPGASQAFINATIALNDTENALEGYEESNSDWLFLRLRELEEIQEDLATARRDLQRFRAYEEDHPNAFSHLVSQWEFFIEIYEEDAERLLDLLVEHRRLEANVIVAQEELRRAAEDLGDLQEGPDLLMLRDLEASIQLAELELDQARDRVAELEDGVDPLLVGLRQQQVESARSAWEQARIDLEEMLAGGDPIDISLKEKQVQLAETTLEQSRYELSLLSQRDRDRELALLEADIALARQKIADARRSLEEATLRAPIAGIVSAVHLEEGDSVGAETVVAEIVDTRVVEIDGVVDEIDVLSIAVGTEAGVTFDALPGEVFDGAVTEIAEEGANQQGVVTYAVKSRVDLPDGVDLREGLTAVVEMVLNEERDVLLVPLQALYGTFDAPAVRVMTDTGAVERRVTLGNSDDFWVAVQTGLREGDTIIMESAEVTTSGAGFRQLRTVSGGGRRR